MISSLLLLLAIGPAACSKWALERSGCEWPDERGESIDPRSPAQQQHLRDDAETAEKLAVRYAHKREGLEQMGDHRRATEQCEAVLFDSIARVHHVTPQQVRQALRRQNDTPF